MHLALMVLGARPGDVLTVIAEGPDAAAAMQALDHLFQRQPIMQNARYDCPPIQSAMVPVPGA